MTKYNLKDFKKWLEEKPERKRGRSKKGWEDTFGLITDWDGKGIDEESAEIGLKDDEILFPYYEALMEFKAFIYPEEEQKKKKRYEWLKEY